jgi:CDP-diacylglycerol--glycerol-3-phosphate 3-phosphatidyltransferase
LASIYDLKPKFQGLLRPITGALAKMGVTANQVTIAACAMSVAWGLWIWASGGARMALLLLPVFLFVRMSMNAIDGMLAREHDQASREGLILNEVGDVISDAAIILPLIAALAPLGAHPAPILLFAFTGMLGEFVGVLGPQLGATRRYDGPMGKSDRALFVGLLTFLLALGLPGGGWLNLAFVLAAVLAALGARNRAVAALEKRA